MAKDYISVDAGYLEICPEIQPEIVGDASDSHSVLCVFDYLWLSFPAYPLRPTLDNPRPTLDNPRPTLDNLGPSQRSVTRTNQAMPYRDPVETQ
jgi:hypothetical protein